MSITYTPLEWLIKLNEDGILPTKQTIIDTVSYAAAWENFNPEASSRRFATRWDYNRKYCFPLMTQEVVADMAKYLHGHKILDVCCGSGYIGKCLVDADDTIQVISTDNLEWERREDFKNWREHFVEVEDLDAVEAIEKYADQVSFVLLSWPPYGEPIGAQILKKCIEKKLPMIYIGEQWGGCTADDEFFDLISDQCEMELITEEYIPYEGIHDDIYVIIPHSTKIIPFRKS